MQKLSVLHFPIIKKHFLKTISSLLILTCLTSFCFAQKQGREAVVPVHKVYFTTSADGNLLSSSLMSKSGSTYKMTTPRFTSFFNAGVNLNFDFGTHAGAFTGLNIKNIGFIEKQGDLTIKRRDYTFGLPLGLKIGNLHTGNYILIGGGIDFPFNYREKSFVKRGDKKKFNEWFSDRVPAAMGYTFIGAHLKPGVLIKLQYYPGNFLNPAFQETVNQLTILPYKGYNVHLMVLSFGFDVPFRPKEFKKKLNKDIDVKDI